MYFRPVVHLFVQCLFDPVDASASAFSCRKFQKIAICYIKKSIEIFCKSVYSMREEPEAFLARAVLPVTGKGLSICSSWNMLIALCVNLILSSGTVFSYLVVIVFYTAF